MYVSLLFFAFSLCLWKLTPCSPEQCHVCSMPGSEDGADTLKVCDPATEQNSWSVSAGSELISEVWWLPGERALSWRSWSLYCVCTFLRLVYQQQSGILSSLQSWGFPGVASLVFLSRLFLLHWFVGPIGNLPSVSERGTVMVVKDLRASVPGVLARPENGKGWTGQAGSAAAGGSGVQEWCHQHKKPSIPHLPPLSCSFLWKFVCPRIRSHQDMEFLPGLQWELSPEQVFSRSWLICQCRVWRSCWLVSKGIGRSGCLCLSFFSWRTPGSILKKVQVTAQGCGSAHSQRCCC